MQFRGRNPFNPIFPSQPLAFKAASLARPGGQSDRIWVRGLAREQILGAGVLSDGVTVTTFGRYVVERNEAMSGAAPGGLSVRRSSAREGSGTSRASAEWPLGNPYPAVRRRTPRQVLEDAVRKFRRWPDGFWARGTHCQGGY